MKYCTNCGRQVDDSAVICVGCGCSLQQNQQNAVNSAEDYASGGLKFLSFLIPILGIIMYAVEHDKHPNKAKSCLKAAIIGFVVSFIFSFIYGVAIVLM